MAMEIYRKTEDEQLRVLSYDIATGQAGQRGEMFDWLVQWGLPQAGGPMMAWMAESESGHDHGGTAGEPMTDEEAHAAMGMATDAELAEQVGGPGAALDEVAHHHPGTHGRPAQTLCTHLRESSPHPRDAQTSRSRRFPGGRPDRVL